MSPLNRFDRMEQKFDRFDEKMDKFGDQLSEIKTQLATGAQNFKALDKNSHSIAECPTTKKVDAALNQVKGVKWLVGIVASVASIVGLKVVEWLFK